MIDRFRHTMVHLALAAMMLQAWLPPGWMPGPASDGAISFVICSPTGLHHLDGSDGHRDSGNHQHDVCPFAAAAHLATPVAGAILAPPSTAILTNLRTAALQTAPHGERYLPQSPRAPPVSI
jgi:hypothetical protein